MRDKQLIVFGVYRHRTSFEHAVSALKVGRIQEKDISVLFQKNLSTKNLTPDDAATPTRVGNTDGESGALIPSPLEWFAATGALVVLGHEMFLIAGPMVATLAGAALGGQFGGLSEALIGLGQPEYEAKRYQARVEEGGMLLFVHCERPSCVKKVMHVLISTGAEDISPTSESSPYYGGMNRPGTEGRSTRQRLKK
ncbi:MAG TPA: hypothetical protein VGI34_04180 [Candidatus Acidoferrales bacterium]|jgi:hypothetical protein